MTVEKTSVMGPYGAASRDIQHQRDTVASHINRANEALWHLNKAIHLHPELCFEEVFAHATLTAFLKSQGFQVQCHAYGLNTAFMAETGHGGRLVIICAEYDALPGIGHGCGHNLIATSSVAAFVGASKTLLELGIAGRVRILGTPAEEGGGGKIKLINAAAFAEDVAAAIMCHPIPLEQIKDGWSGTAGFRTVASRRFKVEFHGKNAHAGQEPWNGVNALDAAVGAYTTTSMLRQQVRPDERIQAIIEHGGTASNIIPDYTRMSWGLRGPSIMHVDALADRVKACIQSAATATGCSVTHQEEPPYMELRVNDALCNEYITEMAALGENVLYMDDKPSSAGTDMGNVSHAVPSFHGMFGIPTPPGVPMHHREFTTASATDAAHKAAIRAGMGLAMLAIRVLSDTELAARGKNDFETV